MCPGCIASASLIASSVISTGGVTALVARIVSICRRREFDAADDPQEFQHPQTKSTESKGE